MKSTDICRWLFWLISLSTWTTFTNSKEMRVVCYYTNWSVYRPGAAKFSPQNINPYLCTHLVYAFGGFTKENTLKPFDKYQDIEKGGYAKFTGLKTYNKNLKTMLAIGGWNEGSTRFSSMVANSERRKELVKNTIKFLRQNHFDGLDLDWEYPTFRDGGKPRDRDNYAQLVQELREEFDRESEKTGRPRLLLTMAVPAGIEYIKKGYDVPKLTKYLDWMNILSYDYHSAFEPAVNHHAPLYSLEEDNEYNYDAELNIDYTIKQYLKLGADPDKLVLGIPTYGRSYTLFNPEAFEIGAPADGPGEMGEATRENGYLAYYEICDYVKNQGWQEEQPDPNAMGPYAYKDNQWVGYDDENIARKKSEYVAENGLGGIMFWAIDNDDFRGNCHGKPYPLIEAAKEALMEAYGLTDANQISPPSKPIKPRARSRPKAPSKVKSSEEESKSPKVTNRRRNRFKSKAKAKDDEERSSSIIRPKTRRKESRKTTETSTYSSLKVTTPSYTTPAPPSTPDLDGAFKCEDEGFFPHPKDCKKYFWCLSGAGDSGIVAHQFTCPAGLYFNKAADSCDYTQNVLCNKKIQKAVTAAPPKTSSTTNTTPAPVVSTTRTPAKITAATSRTTFKQSTTTEAYDDEYEYDDDEEEEEDKENEDSKTASEEDPRVIKELIDLIRKAGGIEELEKQLSKGSTNSSSPDTTTQSAISKTLYERVLSKAKTTLNVKKNPPIPSVRNSRGPQNDGLARTEEKTSRGKSDRGKLQYTSISRKRSSTPKPVEDDEEEEEEIEEEKEDIKPRRLFNKKSQPEYVTIRRPRVSSTTEATEAASEYNRNKILGEVADDEEEYDDEDEDDDVIEDAVPKKSFTPQYVNIRRQRPSTTEETSTSKYKEIRRGSVTEATSDANDDNDESIYKTIRRGSTTSPPTTVASEEVSTSKYQSLRRGTTTPPVTSSTITDESTSNNKYKNFRRGSTSEKPSNRTDEATTRYIQLRRGTTTSTTTSSITDNAVRNKVTLNLTSPTDEENYVTPSFQSVSTETTSAASESIETIPSVSPTETSLGSSSVTSTSTTSSPSPQDATTNPNINLIDEAVTTLLPSTTKKESTSSGTEKYAITTKSSNDDATTAEDKSTSYPSTGPTPTDTPTTQKQRPKPFSANARSTTVKPVTESTTTSKVSQSKFKLRLRPSSSGIPHKDVDNKASSTTDYPNERSSTTKYRTRGSLRATPPPGLGTDKENDNEEDTTSKTKSRRLLTTERPVDERTYRPSEIADLSSLTAADFPKITDLNVGQAHRRRRPTPPSITTTTEEEEELDESLKTSSRTLPLARKLIDSSSFGKSRRVTPKSIEQYNSVELDASATTKKGRGFGFRSTRQPAPITESNESSSTESSSEPVNITPRSRRVVRRFRTTTARSNKLEDTTNKSSSDKLPFRRGKIFATQNRNQSSLGSKESSEGQKNNLQRLFGKKPTRLAFNLQQNKVEEETDDSLEDTSTEEGENIKLSESNIRENSDVNSFDTSGKQRRKLVKLVRQKSDSLHEKSSTQDRVKETRKTTTESSKEGSTKSIEPDITTKSIVTTTDVKELTTTTKSSEEKATEPITTIQPDITTTIENLTDLPKVATDLKTKVKSTEPNGLIRTRKIIRKVKPKVVAATSTLDKTSGRRRKIIRRRPVNGTTTTENNNVTETTTERVNTTPPVAFRPRSRPTSIPNANVDANTTIAKDVSKRVLRPALTRPKSKYVNPTLGRTFSSTTAKSTDENVPDPVKQALSKRVFRPKVTFQRNVLRNTPRRLPSRGTPRPITTARTVENTQYSQRDNADTTTAINEDTTTQFSLRRRPKTKQRRIGLEIPTTENPFTETAVPSEMTTTESSQETSTVYTVEHEEKDENGKVKIHKSSTAIYNLYKPITDESEFDEEVGQKNASRNSTDPKADRNRNYVSVFRSSTTSNTFDNFNSEFELETPQHLRDASDEEEDDGYGDDEYYEDHKDAVDRLIADTSTEFRSEILDSSYSPYDDFGEFESIAESSSVRNRFYKPDNPQSVEDPQSVENPQSVELTTPSRRPSTSPRPKYKTFSKTSNKSIIQETIEMIQSFNKSDPNGKTEEFVVNRFKYRTLERTTAVPDIDDGENSSEESDEIPEDTTIPVDLTTFLNRDDSAESNEDSSEEQTESYSSTETTENYSEELTLPNSSLESDFTTHLNIADRENEIFDVTTKSNEISSEKQDFTTTSDKTTLKTDVYVNQITSTTSNPVSEQSSTLSSTTMDSPLEEMEEDVSTTTSDPLETETETTVTELSTTPLPKPTTPYHRRSTLRSIESRPKFTPSRRKISYSDRSTTESNRAFNRFRARYRSTTESPKVSEKPTRATIVNRFLQRHTSTTEKVIVEDTKEIDETKSDDTEEEPTTVNVTDGDVTETVPVDVTTDQMVTSTAMPINQFIYSHSTTESTTEDTSSEENYTTESSATNIDEEEKEDKEDEVVSKPARPSINFRQQLSTARPRVINRPIKNGIRRPNSPVRGNALHFGRSTTPRIINKPSFTKPTESLKTNEDLSGIDTEAVKNRNKNLFSKKRKINRPVTSTSTTTVATELTELPTDTTLGLEETSTASDVVNEVTEDRITSVSPTTEAVTKPSSVETTESLTTLHHVFAATDGKTNSTETTTESLSSVTTTTGKIEKLIEVNRIIQVKTKEAKVKNRHVVGEQSTAEVAPVIDKIGQINRVTVIKVVDGNETIPNDLDYNDNEIRKSSPISPVYVTTEGASSPLIGIPAKVEEIPASEIMGKVNLTNITVTINNIPELLHTHREDRKFETFSENKNQLTSDDGKTEIVDGISHINVFTPRPIFSTEASTIALEGLFQTDSPQTVQNNKFLTNDEILETEHSRFVNVRVLHQDDKTQLSKAKKASSQFVPVKILGHDVDEITLKAEVVEVTPKTYGEPIKIVPIKVEMSRIVADTSSLPVFRVASQNVDA